MAHAPQQLAARFLAAILERIHLVTVERIFSDAFFLFHDGGHAAAADDDPTDLRRRTPV
jgi:hypothetical protein